MSLKSGNFADESPCKRNDIDRVQVGQEVEISADVLGKETVQGVVERISPTGEAKSSTSSERVIPVYIKVKEENENSSLASTPTLPSKSLLQKMHW